MEIKILSIDKSFKKILLGLEKISDNLLYGLLKTI